MILWYPSIAQLLPILNLILDFIELIVMICDANVLLEFNEGV